MSVRDRGGHPLATAFLVMVLVVAGCSSGELKGSEADAVASTLDPDAELLVIGDWGSGTDAQRSVADAMAGHAADREVAAIVTTGDNFYSDDVDGLMAPFAWAKRRSIPFIVAWGNHDVETALRSALLERTFEPAPRWSLHQWGEVDLVILDSTQPISEEQFGFLDASMRASDAATVIVNHHPPYSCGSHGDTDVIASEWLPRFDDDVVLVLNGHEHNYQTFESEDIRFVISGGGGATLTPLKECPDQHPPRIAGAAKHHFLSLSQDEDIVVTALDVDGEPIDQFSLPLEGSGH